MLNTDKYNKNGGPKTAALCLGLLMCLLLFSGCATNANYGNLRGNKEVTKAFTAYQVLPDYQYFITGPNGRPYAIMGIANDYKFQSRLWQTVNPTEKQMKDWVRSGMYGRLGISPSGYKMTGPGGEQIGILYSMWGDIRFSISDGNNVTVITPNFSTAIKMSGS